MHEVFFLDLPIFVMDNKFVWYKSSVSCSTTCYIVPSLFCKGTVGWKKTFWLAFWDSISLYRFSAKTGFIVRRVKGQVESRWTNLKLGTPACHCCSFDWVLHTMGSVCEREISVLGVLAWHGVLHVDRLKMYLLFT